MLPNCGIFSSKQRSILISITKASIIDDYFSSVKVELFYLVCFRFFDNMFDISFHTTIEDLSTELWCEIFAFFDALELYETFGNINHRITTMLSEHALLYFKIATITDYDFAYDDVLPKVNNLSNVRSIKLNKEFQIEDFFTRWPPNTFSRLCCLSLVYLGALMSDCSIALVEQLSTLTFFESLHIRVGRIVYHDKYLKRLIQLIFIENDSFHSLKRFALRCDHDVLYIPTSTKRTRLELITLPSFGFTKFLQFLPCIPYIKSIKVDRLISDHDEITPVPMPSSDFRLSNCVDLRLHLDYYITYENIELLLHHVPNLTQLKISCDYSRFHGKKWEILLMENCSKLKKFEIIGLLQHRYFALPSFDELRNDFSTTFWLVRNVQYEHDLQRCRLIVRFEI